MTSKLNSLLVFLREDLGLFLSTSLGIFLFFLFFQPFPLSRFDLNNNLLFVSGIAIIIFLCMYVMRLSYRLLEPQTSSANQEQFMAYFISGFIALSLSTVAVVFYLRYVGGVDVTFHAVFKVSLVCLAPTIILRVYDKIKTLSQLNAKLLTNQGKLQSAIAKYEEDYLHKTVEFHSENNSENLKLLVSDVAFIKSADNYVEIVYREMEDFKRKLVRNTLKNIENQLSPFSSFLRCHRMCIVNRHFIEKLNSRENSYNLSILGCEEKLPVSRQYILHVKEVL